MSHDTFIDAEWVDLTRLGFPGYEASPMRKRVARIADPCRTDMYFHAIRSAGCDLGHTYVEAPTPDGLWTALGQHIVALQDSDRRRKIRRVVCDNSHGPGPAYPTAA